MLTLVLLIIVIIVFGLLTDICVKKDSVLVVPTAVILCLSAIFFAIILFAIPVNLIDMPANVAEMNQTYASLTYQMENIDTLYGNSCANDKKALYDEVQKWNETIAKGRVNHESLWWNWTTPIDYNQFDLIELK